MYYNQLPIIPRWPLRLYYVPPLCVEYEVNVLNYGQVKGDSQQYKSGIQTRLQTDLNKVEQV